MNEFDRRWQALAGAARGVAPRPAEAPLGFAARVLARRELAAKGESMALTWQRLGWRAVAGVTGVMVIFAVLEYRDRPASRLGFPHVERTVASALWML